MRPSVGQEHDRQDRHRHRHRDARQARRRALITRPLDRPAARPPTAISTRNGRGRTRRSSAADARTRPRRSQARSPSRTAERAPCRPRSSSRSRLAGGKDVIDADPAIAPLARLELLDRRAPGARARSRARDVLEDQLGVGALPEQEVGQPLLAAGADDQVGRRPPARSTAAASNSRLVEVVRRRAGRRATASAKLARRVGDVGAAAVVEGDLQVEAVVVRRCAPRPRSTISRMSGARPARRPTMRTCTPSRSSRARSLSK